MESKITPSPSPSAYDHLFKAVGALSKPTLEVSKSNVDEKTTEIAKVKEFVELFTLLDVLASNVRSAVLFYVVPATLALQCIPFTHVLDVGYTAAYMYTLLVVALCQLNARKALSEWWFTQGVNNIGEITTFIADAMWQFWYVEHTFLNAFYNTALMEFLMAIGAVTLLRDPAAFGIEKNNAVTWAQNFASPSMLFVVNVVTFGFAWLTHGTAYDSTNNRLAILVVGTGLRIASRFLKVDRSTRLKYTKSFRLVFNKVDVGISNLHCSSIDGHRWVILLFVVVIGNLSFVAGTQMFWVTGIVAALATQDKISFAVNTCLKAMRDSESQTVKAAYATGAHLVFGLATAYTAFGKTITQTLMARLDALPLPGYAGLIVRHVLLPLAMSLALQHLWAMFLHALTPSADAKKQPLPRQKSITQMLSENQDVAPNLYQTKRQDSLNELLPMVVVETSVASKGKAQQIQFAASMYIVCFVMVVGITITAFHLAWAHAMLIIESSSGWYVVEGARIVLNGMHYVTNAWNSGKVPIIVWATASISGMTLASIVALLIAGCVFFTSTTLLLIAFCLYAKVTVLALILLGYAGSETYLYMHLDRDNLPAMQAAADQMTIYRGVIDYQDLYIKSASDVLKCHENKLMDPAICRKAFCGTPEKCQTMLKQAQELFSTSLGVNASICADHINLRLMCDGCDYCKAAIIATQRDMMRLDVQRVRATKQIAASEHATKALCKHVKGTLTLQPLFEDMCESSTWSLAAYLTGQVGPEEEQPQVNVDELSPEEKQPQVNMDELLCAWRQVTDNATTTLLNVINTESTKEIYYYRNEDKMWDNVMMGLMLQALGESIRTSPHLGAETLGALTSWAGMANNMWVVTLNHYLDKRILVPRSEVDILASQHSVASTELRMLRNTHTVLVTRHRDVRRAMQRTERNTRIAERALQDATEAMNNAIDAARLSDEARIIAERNVSVMTQAKLLAEERLKGVLDTMTITQATLSTLTSEQVNQITQCSIQLNLTNSYLSDARKAAEDWKAKADLMEQSLEGQQEAYANLQARLVAEQLSKADLERQLAKEKAAAEQRLSKEGADLKQQFSEEKADLMTQFSEERAKLEKQFSEERANREKQFAEEKAKLEAKLARAEQAAEEARAAREKAEARAEDYKKAFHRLDDSQDASKPPPPPEPELQTAEQGESLLGMRWNPFDF